MSTLSSALIASFPCLLGSRGIERTLSDDSFEAGLVEFLRSVDAVEQLAGNRIYAGAIDRGNNTWPALTYEVVDVEEEHDIDGCSGLSVIEFDVTAVSTRYRDVVALADALRAAIDGFSGVFGLVQIASAWCEGVGDARRLDNGGVWWHSKTATFQAVVGDPVTL